MNKSKSFSTVLFLLATFFNPLNAEDLIINGENVGGYYELKKLLEKNSFDEDF